MSSSISHKVSKDFPGTFLSILLIDYSPSNLSTLLDGIFRQDLIGSFEIILCDDIGDSTTWDIGNQYISKHPGKLTLVRNQFSMGLRMNQQNMISMARGRYYARLSHNQDFNPDHILQTIATLDADPLLRHELIGRVSERALPHALRKEIQSFQQQDQPLVSICVYNYNYGRYLSQCLDSVAAQTYDNIEILFSDNASSDASWLIAMDFSRRYKGRMSLVRNRENFGPTHNLVNCRRNARGKYLLLLCSDDAIEPNFITRCVTLLERNPDAAFALVHRQIIDKTGKHIDTPPFYDQTCLINGEEQAAVYMMAAVNPSISQVLYNHEKLLDFNLPDNFTNRWFGQRTIDFGLCLKSPIIYIKEALLLNREHGDNDGAKIDSSLIQGVGQYMLALQFAETATQHGLIKPAARLGDAIKKISHLCLRYCVNFLLQNDEVVALRYWHLAQALHPEVSGTPLCRDLGRYWQSDMETRKEMIQKFSDEVPIARSVSYSPPRGSLPC